MPASEIRTRVMRRLLLPIATATALVIALAGGYALWKLRAATIIEIAVGPTGQELLPLLQAWERIAREQSNPLRLRLRPVASDQEADLRP